jgi:hypothetical protein
MTARESNYGHSLYGHCPAAWPLLDLLGQGDGRLMCCNLYARAARMTGNPDIDLQLWPIMDAVGLVEIARQTDTRVSDDQAADLASFIIERGMNLMRRPA